MKMFDFKMFWIANELIQREYDSFFFLIPHFWFDNYRSLVQKCQRSSTWVAFLFLREDKGGLTKFRDKYKCQLTNLTKNRKIKGPFGTCV